MKHLPTSHFTLKSTLYFATALLFGLLSVSPSLLVRASDTSPGSATVKCSTSTTSSAELSAAATAGASSSTPSLLGLGSDDEPDTSGPVLDDDADPSGPSDNSEPDNPSTGPSDDPSDETEVPAPPYDFLSPLIIKSINPGAKLNGVSEVGELIELQNISDSPLPLAGFRLTYVYKGGNEEPKSLCDLPDYTLLAGETLSLAYDSSKHTTFSSHYGFADLSYSKTLATEAGVRLRYMGEIVDSVCWTGGTDCCRTESSGCCNKFDNSISKTIVRNLTTGEFEPDFAYKPTFNLARTHYLVPVEEDPPDTDPDDDPVDTELDPEDPDADPAEELNNLAPHCGDLEFSEIFTYYADSAAEQFIEFFNPSGTDINLEGCQLLYKNKTHPLSGTVPSGGHFAYYPDFSLTKNPNSSNSLLLLDTDDTPVDELTYEHGQKKSMSLAKFYDAQGTEYWARTYARTPGAVNVFQEFQTCPAGKIINPLTGNCVKSTTVTATTLAACPDGQYRNPLTGRCKKYETATSSSLKECAEGYERNPVTNRCRKITTPNEGADFALVPSTSSDNTTFAALGIVITIVAIGSIYIILQFRHEITRATRKTRQRLHHFLIDDIPRILGRHGHKDT